MRAVFCTYDQPPAPAPPPPAQRPRGLYSLWPLSASQTTRGGSPLSLLSASGPDSHPLPPRPTWPTSPEGAERAYHHGGGNAGFARAGPDLRRGHREVTTTRTPDSGQQQRRCRRELPRAPFLIAGKKGLLANSWEESTFQATRASRETPLVSRESRRLLLPVQPPLPKFV